MFIENKSTSKFWNFLGAMTGYSVPYFLWKSELGSYYNLEEIRKRYLIPNGRVDLLPCPDPCDSECGFRKVIEHEDLPVESRYEAVCQKDHNNKIPLGLLDSALYSINDVKVIPALARALGFRLEMAKFKDFNDTWLSGYMKMEDDDFVPVFFSLRDDPQAVTELILRIHCAIRESYILLLPTGDAMSDVCREALVNRNAKFLSLSKTLDFNDKFDMIQTAPPLLSNGWTTFPFYTIPSYAQLYRQIKENETSWYVNGILKKTYKGNAQHSIQAMIINILYEQAGEGWIQHQTFINVPGWSRKEYFGENGNPGRMQKQLSVLRKTLGIKIIFDRKSGVKLGFLVKVL